jgi:hypothetical protein
MLELLKGHVGETAAPFIFVALFLIIVGASLYLTPRLARWLDKKDKENPGYFDGMLEEDPKKTAESGKQDDDEGESSV